MKEGGLRTETGTDLTLTRIRRERQETNSLLCDVQSSATHDVNMGPHLSNGVEEGR